MKIPEQMKMILADDDPEHSLAALDSVLGADTKSTPRGKLLRSVYARLIAERVDLRKQMAKSGIEIEKARQRLEKIKQPPLFPGLVVRIGRGERFEVVVAGRRQIVVAHPDLEGVTIDPGDSVLLDHEMAVIVERVGRAEGAGLVGVVRQVADDRVIVSGTGDE